MNTDDYRELLARFDEARVLVVGDIYLDENVYGEVTGVSLEAPIPILEVHERRYNPGAAGNTACNLAALGARACITGVIGDDANARILHDAFKVRGVDPSDCITDPEAPTNTYGKLRSGGHNIPGQEILRTDTPTPDFITGDVEARLIARIRKYAPDVDAIVVVDQVSSVVTDRVLEAVLACAKEHGCLTVGDSRERIGAFEGFDVLIPNDLEALRGAGLAEADQATLESAGAVLLKRARNVLITCGPKGILVFPESGETKTFPAKATHVEDVTGAGDTVTAAATLTLVAGGSLDDAAIVANAAAAIAVGKGGVVAPSKRELEAELIEGTGISKLKTRAQLADLVDRLRNEGKSIVWTNGCFDILHVGHITYLVKAAQEGEVLIVGLNSDASVRAVKGEGRPINCEADRATILAALECVDYLTLFSDPTPLPLLEEFRPDVYTKGGDYTIDTINQEERRLVEGYGGRIAIIPGVKGKSTTELVDRITNGA